MPANHEQLDFLVRMEKKAKPEEIKPKEEKNLVQRKKGVKRVRQFDIDAPAGGRLGGWQSHYDGNINDPDNNK